MSEEARTAVRGAGILAAQRGFHLLAATVFALVVPRMMGADDYGRYALITSLSLWFALLSGLGAVPLMTRFVPQLLLRGDRAGVEKLFSNLLALRLANGFAAAAAYFLLTSFWLRELDWAVLAFVAGSVLIRTGGNLFYTLFLGLNQAARWGMGELLRRWSSLLFLVAGFLLGGLRGACLGLLLAEVLVFGVGFWWGRAYVRRSELRPDRRFLAPFLQFSLLFFAGNLLLTIAQRSGETLVRVVTGDYTEVGYYGVAYAIYQTAAHAVWQITLAFAPLFTTLRERGETEALERWAARLLKFVAAGGVLVFYGTLFVGEDLVPFVLGREFRAVWANLLPLTLALLALGLSSVGRLMALSYDRPGIALQGALLQLAVFWGTGLPLVSWCGSFGGCVAVLLASMAHATYMTWRTRRDVRHAPRTWVGAILLGALFLPLALARSSSWQANVALYTAFAAVYAGLLLALRVLSLEEMNALRRMLRGRKRDTRRVKR